MAKPESEVEELMNAFIPFGQQMLEKNGEFIPFGGVMTLDGKIGAAPIFTAKDNNPSSQDIIDFLKNSFREAAKKNKYKATAIFIDSKVIPPGMKEKMDAIAIALDHRDNYSVIVFIPYKLKCSKFLKRSKVEFGELFYKSGANDIFVS